MKLADFKMIRKDRHQVSSQVLLDFGKYNLSIINGGLLHSGSDNFYEIAVFAANDGVSTGFVQLPGISEDNDVRDYMTADEVNAVITKLYTITGQKPVQI
jgi:hypothetical protein